MQGFGDGGLGVVTEAGQAHERARPLVLVNEELTAVGFACLLARGVLFVGKRAQF